MTSVLARPVAPSRCAAAARDDEAGPLTAVQRGLRELVRTGATASADPYLAEVAASDRLTLVRDVILWWRTLGVQRGCPLTSRLLVRRNVLDETVSRFVAARAISPYVEDLAQQFVTWLAGHEEDELQLAVASFERALMRVKRGDSSRYVVEWPAEPYAVMAALLSSEPLPGGTEEPRWTVISADLPRSFEVVSRTPAGA